jgi:ribonucleoside-diphosphate reductase alpha chain
MQTKTNNAQLQQVIDFLTANSSKTGNEPSKEQVEKLLQKCLGALSADESSQLLNLASQAIALNRRPDVTEIRPQALECDVVRFQNNKDKWVALVGLLDGYPYEIFTGLQDDEEGIILPKSVVHGKIIKQINPDGTKRYDFQFENKRGYKTTVEGLSEKFNPEYWNYAKLISGVLRYRMPLEHVIKLVASLSLKDESINTWKTGVERALKKYLPGAHDEEEMRNEE